MLRRGPNDAARNLSTKAVDGAVYVALALAEGAAGRSTAVVASVRQGHGLKASEASRPYVKVYLLEEPSEDEVRFPPRAATEKMC